MLRRRFIPAAILIGLAGYAALLAAYVGATAGGSDSSGYLNLARLLAEHRVHLPQRALASLPPDYLSARTSSFLYIPLGFRPAPNGAGMVPTYPVGLPLFIWGAHAFLGWAQAAGAAVVFHAMAGLAATYALARRCGLNRGAVLAVAMVGLSPLYFHLALQAMSDVPSLAWTAVAVGAALEASRSARWAALAGAAVAVDVLLRPANLLVLLPVGAALGFAPRRWLALGLGGLPGAIFLGAFNWSAYGRILSTGYGDSWFAFRVAYVPVTLLHFVHWLPLLFSPLVLLALALPWVLSISARLRWVLSLWIVGYGAFYSAYENTHETWWYLRFLLPAAPALAVAAVLVGRATLGAPALWARRAFWLAGAAVVVALSALAGIRWLHPFRIAAEERRYEHVAAWLQVHLPADAVCLAEQETGALTFFTAFTFLRWNEIRPGDAPRIEQALRADRRPLYAVLFAFEAEAVPPPTSRLAGRWRPIGTVEDVIVSEWIPSRTDSR